MGRSSAGPAASGAKPLVRIDWLNLRKTRRRVMQLVRLVRHLGRHLALRRLLREARARGLAMPDGVVLWKPLGEYLSLGMDTATRYRLMISHYATLIDLAGRRPFVRDWTLAPTLWSRQSPSGVLYAIQLGPAVVGSMEGEHELSFRADGRALWTLSFLIGQDAERGFGPGRVLIVGGLQGGRNCLEAIRAATRDNGGSRPHIMLTDAAVVLARALALDAVAAAPGATLPATRFLPPGSPLFDKDASWLQYGAVRTPGGALLIWSREDASAPSGSGRRGAARREVREAISAGLSGADAGGGDDAPSA